MMKTGKTALVILMVFVLLLATGCDEEGKTGQVPSPPATENQQAKNPVVPETPKAVSSQTEIKLYFPNVR